jgi:hypothetical protein
VGVNYNRAVGWGLLLAALAWAARVDAWSLGELNYSTAGATARIFVRHSLVVLFIIALLQLLVARAAQQARTPNAGYLLGCRFTAGGAIAWAAGTVGSAFLPGTLWLLPLSGLLGLAGFALLWRNLASAGLDGRLPPALRVLLPVIGLGMALDVVMSVAIVLPTSALADYFGVAAGLRLRMLRLGRVAAAALPILAFLYDVAAARRELATGVVRIGRWAMLLGAVGMPVLLVLAATVSFELKYALTLPVGAVVLGTWIAAWLAWQAAARFVAASWALIGLSLGVGQWLGTFAFDGPLPAPAFLGAYSGFPRQLVRAMHTYGVLFGMMGICAAHELAAAPGAARRRSGAAIFASGAVLAIAAAALRISGTIPPSLLGLGPGLAAVGLALVVMPLMPAKPSLK